MKIASLTLNVVPPAPNQMVFYENLEEGEVLQVVAQESWQPPIEHSFDNLPERLSKDEQLRRRLSQCLASPFTTYEEKDGYAVTRFYYPEGWGNVRQ